MGRILGRLVLALAWIVVVTPVALLRRLFAGNPMRHAVGDLGYWQAHGASVARDMRKPS